MTTQQLDLFSLPVRPYGGEAPYVKGSETSKAAAEKLDLGPKQRRVLLALYEHGPLSDEAIDRLLHAERPYRPRRVELTKAGYVMDSGQQIKGTSGLMVSLWQLTELGTEYATRIAAAAPAARQG